MPAHLGETMRDGEQAALAHFAHFGHSLTIWPDRLEVRYGRWTHWPPWCVYAVTIARGDLRDVWLLDWGGVLMLEDSSGRVVTIALGEQTEAALAAIQRAGLLDR